MNNKQYLRHLAELGAQKKGISLFDERYKQRLNEELDLILNNNLEDYFLNTAYMVNLLKSKNIPVGAGRGSGGGCLLNYLLDITEIDPIKYKLLFSRFLNATRIKKGSLPDIDTDISQAHRQEALDLLKDEFGRNQTFNVVNNLRFTFKTALKDISRVLGISYEETNYVTKQIPDKLSYAEIMELQVVKTYLKKYSDIKKFLKPIIGMNKTYSKHAGALLTFPNDIENYASTLKLHDTLCVCYDGRTCESLGFVKQDMLGLETTDIIQETLDLIGNDIKIPEPYNDRKVFNTINNNSFGVFQLDTPSASAYAYQLHIESFEEIVNCTALIRPAAADAGTNKEYIIRKNNPF